jgi:hypothetical protein
MVASRSGFAGSKSTTSGRILVRRKWSGQEVPSGASIVQHVRADEFQHRLLVVEMPDLVAVLRDQPANHRHQPGRHRAAFGGGQGRQLFPPKAGLPAVFASSHAAALLMIIQRGLIAVLGRVGPGEQPVAFQHRALGLRVFDGEFLQPQAQFIARLLPRQPADLIAEDLGRQLARIDRAAMAMIASEWT